MFRLLFLGLLLFSTTYQVCLGSENNFLQGYTLESAEDAEFFPDSNKFNIKKPVLYKDNNRLTSNSAVVMLTKNSNELDYLYLIDNVNILYNNFTLLGGNLKFSRRAGVATIDAAKGGLVTVSSEDSFIETKKIELDLNKLVAVLRGSVSYSGLGALNSFNSDVAVISFVLLNESYEINNIKAVGNVVVKDNLNNIKGDSAYFDKKSNILEINGDLVILETKDGSIIETCGVIINTVTRKNKIISCNNIIKGRAVEQ